MTLANTTVQLNAAESIEAGAFVFNSKLAGDKDKIITADMRQQGMSEPVIAAAFDKAAAANVQVPWLENPPAGDLDLVTATLVNESRTGKSFKDILLKMRATGLAARAAGKKSPFSSEALIAEAVRLEQLRNQPGPAPVAAKKSRVGLVLFLLLGAAAVGGVIIWRRRKSGASSGMPALPPWLTEKKKASKPKKAAKHAAGAH